MSFYKSGFRRVLRQVSTVRAKTNELATNEKADDINRSNIDIKTTTNAAAIATLNTGALKISSATKTIAQWNTAAVDGIYTFPDIDLRRDVVYGVRIEWWDPDAANKTPTNLTNGGTTGWIMSTGGHTNVNEMHIASSRTFGAKIANGTGVYLEQAAAVGSYARTATAQNSNFNPASAVPLKFKLTAELEGGTATQKCKVTVIYSTVMDAETYE